MVIAIEPQVIRAFFIPGVIPRPRTGRSAAGDKWLTWRTHCLAFGRYYQGHDIIDVPCVVRAVVRMPAMPEVDGILKRWSVGVWDGLEQGRVVAPGCIIKVSVGWEECGAAAMGVYIEIEEAP